MKRIKLIFMLTLACCSMASARTIIEPEAQICAAGEPLDQYHEKSQLDHGIFGRLA